LISRPLVVAVAAIGSLSGAPGLAQSRSAAGPILSVVTLTFHYAAAVPSAASFRPLAGILLIRAEGPVGVPVLVEEGQDPRRDVAASARLATRAERVRFAVEDGPAVEAPPAAGIVVFNFYYAKLGQVADVLAQRLHASDVREKLGRPRGAVLRRLDGGADLPDVLWRCADPDAAARAADTAALEAAPEWKPVPVRMGTLLRHFARGTYAVVRH
jgi:hypothetical protein